MPNTTLKSPSHTDYDANESWWDRTTGVLRLNQGYTADAPLSHPTADPGYTLYAVFNAALDNANVYPSLDTRIGLGIYAKQSGLPSGDWDYLYGAHTVTAEVSGTVATPTSRSYFVHTRTSRGFSLLSSVTTEASAPSDTDFSNGAVVFLTWPRPLQFGVIGYDVYRNTEMAEFADTGVDTGAETITTNAAHGLTTGDSVTFIQNGTLPAPLAENTAYFVRVIDSDTFELYDTKAHAEGSPATTGRVNLTTTGTAGPHTVQQLVMLRTIETGLTSMQDNNSIEDDYPTYPTADYTGLRAYTATMPGVLTSLSIDGVDPAWDTLPFAIKVPANFNKGSMNDTQIYQQWMRISLFGADGATDRLDWRGINVQPTGTLNPQEYVIPGGGVTVDLTGKTANVYSKYGTITATVSGVTLPDTVLLGFGGEWNGPDGYTGPVTLVVTGGGQSGDIHIDLTHLSYGPNAIFAFHPDDLSQDRGVPPVNPNGSTQGGTTVVTGNGDGTVFGNQCVAVTEMVTVTDGAGAIFQTPAQDCDAETLFFNHARRITQLANCTYHKAELWRVETANGFKCDTSESHKYLTHTDDQHGTSLKGLNIGDEILTCIDGVPTVTTISDKYAIGQGIVAQFDLPQDRRFLAGTWQDGVCRKWGGIASHNKQDNPDIIIVV